MKTVLICDCESQIKVDRHDVRKKFSVRELVEKCGREKREGGGENSQFAKYISEIFKE